MLFFFIVCCCLFFFFFFFFNDTATTEIYTLSLHDALPIRWPAAIGGRIAVSPRSYLPRTCPRPPALPPSQRDGTRGSRHRPSADSRLARSRRRAASGRARTAGGSNS